jgi:hypothetical protein
MKGKRHMVAAVSCNGFCSDPFGISRVVEISRLSLFLDYLEHHAAKGSRVIATKSKFYSNHLLFVFSLSCSLYCVRTSQLNVLHSNRFARFPLFANLFVGLWHSFNQSRRFVFSSAKIETPDKDIRNSKNVGCVKF